jgi:hypothetical protein
MRNEAASKALETTNLILGAGLACAAFVFTAVPAAALCPHGAWAEWSNMTLGYWTVVAPLDFGAADAAMWTHVLVGICVAAIATMQLMGKRETSAFEQSGKVTRRAPEH